ncbi:MAG: SWI/SNF chromatin-remodeling complex subunit [Trichoglossum hirsutum]|nr:MAG: SWI/SNF chromatin-remodeling complex subunit [Trichoglossum hirsutum]
MRYTPVDIFTDQPLANSALQPGQPPPPNVKFQYFPRIRCHDCPGKLYTPGPGMTVENFEVHLKNRQHRERVERRTRGF